MSQGPVANVVTTASNAVWYTDKCEIVTGSTPVTYQVYATALRDQAAQGNIYSDPASVDANSSQEIYVGVGNYLTITGSNFTAQEIGGQTSAQAGVGGYGINGITPPPDPGTTPSYPPATPNVGDGGGAFNLVPGAPYPSINDVTTGWTVNPTGWIVNSINSGLQPPSGEVYVYLTGGASFSTADYSFSAPPPAPANVTPWYQCIGGGFLGPTTIDFNNITGTFPCLNNVVAGWNVYSSESTSTPMGQVTGIAFGGTTQVDVTGPSFYGVGLRYRFSPP